MNHIYLIGFMGTGKSTVGRALAEDMGCRLLDTDEMIISRDGRDIPTIFAVDGEDYFRGIESDVMADIAAMTEPVVVSCGGGVVLSDKNITAMRSSGYVVWLTASAKEILRRVETDTSRPLLADKKSVEDINSMIEARRARYEAAADIAVDTEKNSGEIVLSLIKEGYGSRDKKMPFAFDIPS